MSNSVLENEFKYFIDHQDELVKKYSGKYVVIKKCEVIGVFDDELQAIEETKKKYELGTFLVQYCKPGKDSYTQVYHSRVLVA